MHPAVMTEPGAYRLNCRLPRASGPIKIMNAVQSLAQPRAGGNKLQRLLDCLLDGRRHTGQRDERGCPHGGINPDRKSTRLNSSHSQISYAVFCLKKKTTISSTSARALRVPHICSST